jgi:hypothetical protein
MPKNTETPKSIATIFTRLWEGGAGRLSVPAARQALKLEFPEEDLRRMGELAAKNGDGTITPAELAEYDDYVKVADLLAILQSKARQVLGVKPLLRGRRG